jgi:predicted AAA+ superfamily ATPase
MVMFIIRNVQNQILKLNNELNVFSLFGSPQSGKTTFLKQLADTTRKYVDLTDPAMRVIANEEPVLFLQRYAPPVLIDNIQYAPELVPVIKDYALRSGKSGDFWLIAPKEYAEELNAIFAELGDKFACLELCGLSSAEIDGRESTPFVPEMGALAGRMQNAVPHDVLELYARIWRGDKPAMYNEGADWQSYYAKLVQNILQRDIRNFVQLNDEMKFYRFLCAAASQTAKLLNYAAMAKETGISIPTAKQWLGILEKMGLVYLLQPAAFEGVKYVVKTPKLYFTDTGMAAYLLRWNSSDALELGAMSAEFFETWVIGEVYKSFANSGQKAPLYYYRNFNGKEVELLILHNGVLYPCVISKSAQVQKMYKRFNIIEAAFGGCTEVKTAIGSVICLVPEFGIDKNNIMYIPAWMI